MKKILIKKFVVDIDAIIYKYQYGRDIIGM